MARYLIDSHIFIWAIDAPERLLAAEREILDDSTQDLSVSIATFWELSIKIAKGSLRPRSSRTVLGDDFFARQARIAGFTVLPIEAPECEHVRRLPPLHGDPFDRLLIAQALIGGRTIITRDAVFARYPGVQVFSA